MSEAGRIALTAGVLLIMLVGLLGTVLPVLPGNVLILAGALIYAVVDRFQTVGWPTLAALAALTLLGAVADWWLSSVGARLGGASIWSILAGLTGGVVGLLLFSLPGGIVGAVLGVFLAELARLRDWRQALRAGGGWLAGWLASGVLRVAVALAMIAIFVWQLIRG